MFVLKKKRITAKKFMQDTGSMWIMNQHWLKKKNKIQVLIKYTRALWYQWRTLQKYRGDRDPFVASPSQNAVEIIHQVRKIIAIWPAKEKDRN